MANTWTFSIKDNVSATADKMADRIERTRSALKRLGAEEERRAKIKEAVAPELAGLSSDKAREKALKKITKELEKQDKLQAKISGKQAKSAERDRAKAARQQARATKESMAQGPSSGTSGVLGGLAVGAAYAGISALKSLGTMAWDALGAIGAAQEFKLSTMIAFENILKSKEAASKAYATAQKIAIDTGMDYRESISGFNSLLAQGFSTSFTKELMLTMADLKTINPAAKLEGITRAISQIKSTGKLQGDEMMQLAEAGLNVGAVYETIAKNLGIVAKNGKSAVEQVQDLQKKGKISSDTAITAIMQTIKAQTGGKPAGTIAAEKANKTLTGVVMKALAFKEILLESIKIDWSPVVRFIERIQAALASPAGQKFVERITGVFNMLIGKLDTVTGKDIEKWLDRVGESFVAMADAMDRTVTQLGVVSGLIDRLDGLTKKTSGNSALSYWFKSVSSGIELIIWPFHAAVAVWDAFLTLVEGAQSGGFSGFLSALGDVASGIWAWISGIGASIAGFFGTIWETITSAAHSLGSDTVDGIISGIESGASGIVDALVGACESAINAAKEALDINSPSGVAHDLIGAPIPEGAVEGVEAGAPDLAKATYRMAHNAGQSGAMVAGRTTNVGGSSDNSRTNIFNQTFNGSDAENQRALGESMASIAASGA